MALIDCPTCGQAMAGSARRCPHCGALSPRSALNRRTLVLTIVLTAFIAAVFLAIALNNVSGSSHLSITNVTAPP